jgi:hypothetical protein
MRLSGRHSSTLERVRKLEWRRQHDVICLLHTATEKETWDAYRITSLHKNTGQNHGATTPSKANESVAETKVPNQNHINEEINTTLKIETTRSSKTTAPGDAIR